MRISDWSSDVCSSDLAQCRFGQAETGFALDGHGGGDRDGRSRLAVDPEVEADRRQFLERYILGQTVYHVKKTGRIVERAGLRQRIDDLVQVARRQMERAEERSEGKECVSTGRSRGSPNHQK